MSDCGCAGTLPIMGGAPVKPPRWNKDKMKKDDLILWAKKLGIKNYSKMNKEQLLKVVSDARKR